MIDARQREAIERIGDRRRLGRDAVFCGAVNGFFSTLGAVGAGGSFWSGIMDGWEPHLAICLLTAFSRLITTEPLGREMLRSEARGVAR